MTPVAIFSFFRRVLGDPRVIKGVAIFAAFFAVFWAGRLWESRVNTEATLQAVEQAREDDARTIEEYIERERFLQDELDSAGLVDYDCARPDGNDERMQSFIDTVRETTGGAAD